MLRIKGKIKGNRDKGGPGRADKDDKRRKKALSTSCLQAINLYKSG